MWSERVGQGLPKQVVLIEAKLQNRGSEDRQSGRRTLSGTNYHGDLHLRSGLAL